MKNSFKKKIVVIEYNDGISLLSVLMYLRHSCVIFRINRYTPYIVVYVRENRKM